MPHEFNLRRGQAVGLVCSYPDVGIEFGDGEKLVVNPATQARAQDRVVMTDLVARKETVSIGYRMRLIDGSWRVVDVYFKNTTSQLSTLRSEYAATFSSGGAPALVKKLNAKSDELMAGG